MLIVLAAGASGQQSNGTLGSGACDRTTRKPTARLRTHTAHRAPVASIDTLRMTAIEHRTHTRGEPRTSRSEQHLARSRWCSIFRTFISSCVNCCCIPRSWKIVPSSKPKLSFWVLVCSSFKPDFDLVWKIAFGSKPNHKLVFRKHPYDYHVASSSCPLPFSVRMRASRTWTKYKRVVRTLI